MNNSDLFDIDAQEKMSLFVCGYCGSCDVCVKLWYNPNSSKIVNIDAPEQDDDAWCVNCQDYCRVERINK